MTTPNPHILKRVPTPGLVCRSGQVPTEVFLGFGPAPVAVALMPNEEQRRYPSLDALLDALVDLDPGRSLGQVKLLRDAEAEARCIRPGTPWRYLVVPATLGFRTLTVVRMDDAAKRLALLLESGTPFVEQASLGLYDFNGEKLFEPKVMAHEVVTATRIEGREAMALADLHSVPLWSIATEMPLTHAEATDMIHRALGPASARPFTDEQMAKVDALFYVDIEDLVRRWERDDVEILRWTCPP